MTLQSVKYVGDPRYPFQIDTPAEVLRIVWYSAENVSRRLCLHLRYPDGREDFAPLSEAVQREFLK